MPNIMKLVKQVTRIKEEVLKKQEELAQEELEYKAGGGAIAVTISGAGKIKAVKLDPKVVDPGDVSGLEDLLVSAVSGAQSMAAEHADAEIKKVTGGINLPPEFGV